MEMALTILIALVDIQYSQDQSSWYQISTVTPNADGTFSAEFAFRSSGIYIVRATSGSSVASYTQTVADYLVSAGGNIQTAINSLPTGGGTVYIERGTFDLNDNSLVVRSNLLLIGSGIYQTIIRLNPTELTSQSGVKDGVTSTSNVANLTLRNFTFIQNVVPLNNHGGIDLRGGQNDNITISDVKVTDASGGGISVPNCNNCLIQDCIVERAWTGIIVTNSTNAIIRENTVINTTGDGIFPESGAINLMIENNQLENIGDTAIDVSCPSPGINENVTVANNTILNGSTRTTNSINVQFINNTIQNGDMDIDDAQGPAINISITGNRIVSQGQCGIEFRGATNSSAENNIITMESPSTNLTQSGICAAIWGTGLISNNTISDSANYGIDFQGWGLGEAA